MTVHHKQGTHLRLFFYTLGMRSAEFPSSEHGSTRSLDLSKLGVALVAGAAVIYAIRNARREATSLDPHSANRGVEEEIEYAVAMSARIIATATSKHGSLFEQKLEPLTTGVVDEATAVSKQDVSSRVLPLRPHEPSKRTGLS